MVSVIDVSAEVAAPTPQRKRETRIDTILVHRVGVDAARGISLGDTAIEVCAHFTGRDTSRQEVALSVGRSVPYHYVAGTGDHAGTIWRTLPVDRVGWHALSWSRHSIGVAVIGDYRTQLPRVETWCAVVELIAALCLGHGVPSSSVLGHDEARGASRDASKRCPGVNWDMRRVRREVEGRLAELRAEIRPALGI